MNRKEIAIGDVYYAKVECNGSVQGGYRPYVVMQNDIGNKYSPNVVLIPLTTAIKKEKCLHMWLFDARKADCQRIAWLYVKIRFLSLKKSLANLLQNCRKI